MFSLAPNCWLLSFVAIGLNSIYISSYKWDYGILANFLLKHFYLWTNFDELSLNDPKFLLIFPNVKCYWRSQKNLLILLKPWLTFLWTTFKPVLWKVYIFCCIGYLLGNCLVHVTWTMTFIRNTLMSSKSYTYNFTMFIQYIVVSWTFETVYTKNYFKIERKLNRKQQYFILLFLSNRVF